MTLLPRLKNMLVRTFQWKNTFPITLISLFIIAVGFGVHGSSIGVYDGLFNGKQSENLLFGAPQEVRTDEWLVISQMTSAQRYEDFAATNENLGNGQDMVVLLDAPHRDWTTALRPWNLGFLVLPFDNAFAFKWWGMFVMLGLAAYALALRLFPKKYLLASIVATFIICSPFIHWWYREYTVGLLAFAFGGLAALLALHQTSSPKKKLLLAGVAAYMLAGFAFIQYPPFQLMVAFPIALFYIGYLINEYRRIAAKKLFFKNLAYVAGALIVAVGAFGIFYIQHKDTITTIASSTFPGKRAFTSGAGTPEMFAHTLSSNLAPQALQRTPAAASYHANKSEAAQFIQYSLLLLPIVLFILVRQYRQRNPLDWRLILLSFGLIAIYTYIFIPHLEPIFRFLLFDKVPLQRFKMGIGLIDLFLLLLIARHFMQDRFKKQYTLAACYAVVVFLTFVAADLYVRHYYPGYISNLPLIAVYSFVMAFGLLLILVQRAALGFGLLALFSVVSISTINPLYRGTAPLTDTPLATAIRQIADQDPKGRWAATDTTFESYAIANGARTLSGNYSYSQKDLWKILDPENDDFEVYDRSVHAYVAIADKNDLELAATNRMVARINPCSAEVKKIELRYIIIGQPIKNSCLQTAKVLALPTRTIYIYKVTPPTE
ncbi:MAG TPA: hypothetical protein VFZ48_05905 [Candidatus Saccharimonadales bacterium]